jgi:hypothetical protein
VVENMFAVDLSYLQDFYRQINELEPVENDWRKGWFDRV